MRRPKGSSSRLLPSLWRFALLALVLDSTAAHGDGPPTSVAANETLSTRVHTDDLTAPTLTSAFLPLPVVQRIGAPTEIDTTTVHFGSATSLILEGTHWSNAEPFDHPVSALDPAARGWAASARFARELGPLTLELSLADQHVDSRFGVGDYVDAGLALSHYFKLSRSMTAFIRLSLGYRTWLGQPVLGGVGGGLIGLSIGATF